MIKRAALFPFLLVHVVVLNQTDNIDILIQHYIDKWQCILCEMWAYSCVHKNHDQKQHFTVENVHRAPPLLFITLWELRKLWMLFSMSSNQLCGNGPDLISPGPSPPVSLQDATVRQRQLSSTPLCPTTTTRLPKGENDLHRAGLEGNTSFFPSWFEGISGLLLYGDSCVNSRLQIEEFLLISMIFIDILVLVQRWWVDFLHSLYETTNDAWFISGWPDCLNLVFIVKWQFSFS